MFAEMIKAYCNGRSSCFGCPCEYTCHALPNLPPPFRWGEDSLRIANRVIDLAISNLIKGGEHDASNPT